MAKFGGGLKRKREPRGIEEKFARLASKQEITILPELQAFIPPLKEDEISQLEKNILLEGVRDPLVIWSSGDKNILIDGHNRYQIIQKHKLDYKLEKKEFPNIEAVKDWMINLQLGRRNLTKEQAGYLRGLQHNREKKRLEDNFKKDNNSPKRQNVALGKTAEKLAEQHKVSYRTIERDAQYAKGIDSIGEKAPEIKKKILSGNLKVNKSNIQAVATGKLPVKNLIETIESTNKNTPTKEIVPQEQPLAFEKLTKKQNEKVGHLSEKIQSQIEQLLKLKLTKTQVKSVLSEALKKAQKD